MGPLFFILIIVLVAVCFFFMRKSDSTRNTNTDNTPDKLKMYFGEDYGKIMGTSGMASAPAATNMDNFTPPSASFSSGKGPVNAVIQQKTGSIGLLGIRLILPHPQNVPTEGNEKFCSLVSLMIARGIACCTKAGKNAFSLDFINDEEKITVRCVHPASDMNDGNIRAAAEELAGSLSHEETEEGTADMAVIPKNNII